MQMHGVDSSCCCEIDMKIVAVIENSITAGGGFNQALNAIQQMKKICDGEFEFEVLTTQFENMVYLESLGVNTTMLPTSIVDRVLSKLGLSQWWAKIYNRNSGIGFVEKKLNELGCDLVYFVSPSVSPPALKHLNFIMTVWDLCHRDMPEFPEIREISNFYARDEYYRNHIPRAVMVMTDSECLSDSITQRYGADHNRMLSMPFSPTPFLDTKTSLKQVEVLRKYNLSEGYYFYPAQFWAHKNHIRILEALVLLKEKGLSLSVVFAGGDQGNRSYVEAMVSKYKLDEQVRLLGFVAAEDMRGLYENCQAVVMPTYFGPTNLPPLEAWSLGKPLIYSKQFGAQTGNAAILINPDDAHDLASAMEACLDSKLCGEMSKKGSIRLYEIELQRKKSEDDLLVRLIQFEMRRKCWM